MEIKSSHDISHDFDGSIDEDWINIKELRKELCDRAENVRLASGNTMDYGYLDCLETLIDYIDELKK